MFMYFTRKFGIYGLYGRKSPTGSLRHTKKTYKLCPKHVTKFPVFPNTNSLLTYVTLILPKIVVRYPQVHPPKSQVYSGVPTMMMIDLRDACGALTTQKSFKKWKTHSDDKRLGCLVYI